MTEFYDHVMVESRVISKIKSRHIPIKPMTSDDHKLHEAATECVNCGEPFSDRNLKVHHHDHVTGEYLFAACQKCNLQLKSEKRAKNVNIFGRERRTTEKISFSQYCFTTWKIMTPTSCWSTLRRSTSSIMAKTVVCRSTTSKYRPKTQKNIFNSKLETSAFGLISVSFHVGQRTGILALKVRKGQLCSHNGTSRHRWWYHLCQGSLPLFICRFVREIRRNSTTVDKRIPRKIEKRTVVGGWLSSARHVASFRL